MSTTPFVIELTAFVIAYKYLEWRMVMFDKHEALLRNATWTLVTFLEFDESCGL